MATTVELGVSVPLSFRYYREPLGLRCRLPHALCVRECRQIWTPSPRGPFCRFGLPGPLLCAGSPGDGWKGTVCGADPRCRDDRGARPLRGWLLRSSHWQAGTILLLGLLITTGLTVGSALSYGRNERRLTSLQTKLTASVLQTAQPQLQARLGRVIGATARRGRPDGDLSGCDGGRASASGPVASATVAVGAGRTGLIEQRSQSLDEGEHQRLGAVAAAERRGPARRTHSPPDRSACQQ